MKSNSSSHYSVTKQDTLTKIDASQVNKDLLNSFNLAKAQEVLSYDKKSNPLSITNSFRNRKEGLNIQQMVSEDLQKAKTNPPSPLIPNIDLSKTIHLMTDEEKVNLIETFNSNYRGLTSKSQDNYEINFFHKVSYRESDRFRIEAETKMDSLLKQSTELKIQLEKARSEINIKGIQLEEEKRQNLNLKGIIFQTGDSNLIALIVSLQYKLSQKKSQGNLNSQNNLIELEFSNKEGLIDGGETPIQNNFDTFRIEYNERENRESTVHKHQYSTEQLKQLIQEHDEFKLCLK